MKIIIDTIPLLSPLTGIGKYTYEISRRLPLLNEEHDYSYYYGYFSHQLRCGEGAGGAGSYLKEKLLKIRGIGRLARKMKGVVGSLSTKKFDLYFEPNFIPLDISAKRTVTTIADFSFLVQPEWHPKARIEYFQEFFWKRIGKADRIIVISDFIKESAIEYGIPEEILRTVYLGVDRECFYQKDKNQLEVTRNKFNLPENFLLYVGSIEPRKNLLRLVQAYLSLEKSIRKEYKLVLVGFKGWENHEIMELLSRSKEDVIYTGYVSDQELGDIYNLASLFAYPSLYEGFGLPALEAMACGCPVVASNVTSLPEVCGDAALLVDPLDEASIAEGIRRLVSDETLRLEFRKKGLDRVKLFSWERSAKEHMKVFEEACRS